MTHKHTDIVTLLSAGGVDKDILTRKGFDVNLRLAKTSSWYNSIICQVCDYLRWCAMTEKEGYKKPHGFSGANAGIPLNIIALGYGEVLINPHVLEHSKETVESESNCGSLLLNEPILIKRWKWIRFEYWTPNYYERRERKGYFPTIQHEIDHNLGILITDRKA